MPPTVANLLQYPIKPGGQQIASIERQVLFDKLDGRLEADNDIHQVSFQRLELPRQFARSLPGCHLQLVQRIRFDHIAHRLGLGEIHAPMQKSPQSKLSGLRQARALAA